VRAGLETAEYFEFSPLRLLELPGPGRGSDNDLFGMDVPELGLNVFHTVLSTELIPRSFSDELYVSAAGSEMACCSCLS
jgi:hypothetical protein